MVTRWRLILRFQALASRRTACLPRGWLATDHGDNPLALARLQPPLLARTRLLIQRRIQPLLRVTPGNRPHGFRGHTPIARHPRRSLSLVELPQDQSPPQYPRRFPSLVQHTDNLLPVPLPKLDMHPMVGLHVYTISPFASLPKCLLRYISMRSET